MLICLYPKPAKQEIKMLTNKYYLPLLLLFSVLAPALISCNTPPYYDNVKKVFPAVVRIVSGDRMGSGIIITREGYVLTGQHVVTTSKTVTVMLNNGGLYEAPVTGADEATDLAFIKLPGKEGGYPFAAMGDSAESDDLQTGGPVLVAGYPAGNDIKNLMLSTGVVCAFRKIESVDYIQSDATVYSGSSGGPMLSSKGDVIGIINSKYMNLKESCATFATAINTAKVLFARVEKELPIGVQQVTEPVITTTAVVIRNVKTDNVTSNGALISWETSVPASSGIEIGLNDFTKSYASSGGKPATVHSVQLSGLETKMYYRFRIVARDKLDKPTYSSTYDLLTERAPCSNVGCKAPDFSLNTTDGRTISLNSYKGRKIILVFTSAGCSSCAEVMRCIQQIYDNWPREQMEVIVVVSLEKAAEVDRWIKLYGIKTPVVLDPAGDVTNQYHPAKMPALYFLDSEGAIKSKVYAPLGGCGKQIDALLRLY
jgi:cytochrome c biogenesis protein CcmG/thiol:disulfide interchange protein DsbE